MIGIFISCFFLPPLRPQNQSCNYFSNSAPLLVAQGNQADQLCGSQIDKETSLCPFPLLFSIVSVD